jgi:hypothetical protein
MRAYETIRFVEGPDVEDIRVQGRKTSVGRIPVGKARGYGSVPEKIVRSERGYNRPAYKARIRRTMKRIDRARVARFIREVEN